MTLRTVSRLVASWNRILWPTKPFGNAGSSCASRCARLRAAMRRGCVQPMMPLAPRPMVRQIFGSCVVLPDPVSPHTIVTGCAAMSSAIRSRCCAIGSSSGNRISAGARFMTRAGMPARVILRRDRERDAREDDTETGGSVFGAGKRREARGALQLQALAGARLDGEGLRARGIRKRLHFGAGNGEKHRQGPADELIVRQAEEALGRGIARDHVALRVALDLRQRGALEERFQAVGAVARALHGGAAHGHAMREVAILALELLVEHRGEGEEVVALQLHAEVSLEELVQLARVEDDREAEE